jgi:hypothetical protein
MESPAGWDVEGNLAFLPGTPRNLLNQRIAGLFVNAPDSDDIKRVFHAAV